MNYALRTRLANAAPALGKVRRTYRCIADARLPVRSSYAQHGEDRWAWDFLRSRDLRRSLYVDVGANHPTSLSNTYLLYRMGLRGVVVEPNRELRRYHRLVRPGDIVIEAGCGRECGIGQFGIKAAPSVSSFSTSGRKAESDVRTVEVAWLPILTLDSIVRVLDFDCISYLSVDTEGMDYEVLLGGRSILPKVMCATVEIPDDGKTVHDIMALMQDCGLVTVGRRGCNFLFENRAASSSLP